MVLGIIRISSSVIHLGLENSVNKGAVNSLMLVSTIFSIESLKMWTYSEFVSVTAQ